MPSGIGAAVAHKIAEKLPTGGTLMTQSTRRWTLAGAAAFAAGAALVLSGTHAAAQSKEPIKIGFSMAMTGGLGPNGQSALLAQKIWEEDINAKGGLLGRPVKLIYYDDQTNPSTIPGIYSKLLDVDKVDLIIGGYGTNMLAPAMPLVMQRKKMFIGLLGLGVNTEFNYPNYFVMIPSGPDPKPSFSKGFIDLAMKQDPKPQTIAIVAADAEFARNGADGARENAKKAGLRIVYDRTYPPATTDFAPIVRAVQATNPDIFVICSYPPDSVGMVRAVNEIGFKPKMIGAGMVGLQNTSIKAQLGPLLNGFTNYDFWLPVPKMQFPGVNELMQKYQARAASAGVDSLGYYMAPQAYAQMQVLEQAIEATKSLDDEKLADHIRKTTFKTVLGDVKFGKGGEWAESRVLQVQFQNVKGNSPDQFKDVSTQVVVDPPEYASGKVIYPYEKAK
jgi:branched-chain amino acid transport system substrate-binding protein